MTWPILGGVAGLSGIAALFAGALFSVLARLAMRGAMALFFRRFGNLLLLLALPLLVFAAHCLDLIDKKLKSPSGKPERKGRG